MARWRSYLSAWGHGTRIDLGVGLIALAQFAVHMWVAAHDQFFRDEMYYVAASRHLDFGYVDFPPMTALAVAGERVLFGGSLIAMRLLPAVAGAVIILLAADMVREMGGGRGAQLLTAAAVALAPVLIGASGLMSMDPLDELWWTLCAWTVVRLVHRQEPRLWLLFGLFAGLGLLTKLTMGFYAGALVAGLLLSNQRRLLFHRWIIFGGLIAAALVAPYIAWNIAHGFPTLEFTGNYAGGKTFQVTPLEFFGQQVVTLNVFALPLWLGGLYCLFFTAGGKPYRALGWAHVLLYIVFMLLKTKFYWLAGAYPALFAAGALGLQTLIEQRPRLRWVQAAAIPVVIISGLLMVPFAVPLLSPEAFVRVNGLIGGAGGVQTENLATSELPQSFADRYGWQEIVGNVKAAYDTLTPQEQTEACVFTSNYGEAGAVDLYGPALGLPKAISGHNSYFIWGPQGCSGKVLITVNVPLADIASGFESVNPAGETHCEYCMPYENHAPIFIARGLKAPINDAWAGTKKYN